MKVGRHDLIGLLTQLGLQARNGETVAELFQRCEHELITVRALLLAAAKLLALDYRELSTEAMTTAELARFLVRMAGVSPPEARGLADVAASVPYPSELAEQGKVRHGKGYTLRPCKDPDCAFCKVDGSSPRDAGDEPRKVAAE